MSWTEISKTKQASLKALIPSEWRIPADKLPPKTQTDVSGFVAGSRWFTAREIEIVETDAGSLLEGLAKGQWSSVEVTRAFCKVAVSAQELTNCLTEILFEEALTQAQECDAYLTQHGVPKGPLHGLPISLKDNFNIVGKDSTIGLSSLANHPATENSILVDILLEAGAVLYVKTNVPPAMMMAETVNHVFGRTLNPLRRELTAGGSSGGEAALIAFGGSRIGVGTDIGGSLRIPAACTGLFTLRPSVGRFPNSGSRVGLSGQEAVAGVNGPMAKTLREISLYSKVIIDQEPWIRDPKCIPIPWRTVEKKKKLKLAVLRHNGVVTPTPPVARALNETVEKLKAAGHEIIEWEPTYHAEAETLVRQLWGGDGGKSIRSSLEPTGEPFRPEMKVYEEATESSVYDIWQRQAARSELQRKYLERWNAVGGLDGILCPTTPYTSVEHGKFAHAGYTVVFNLLDYSAVSFPCGIRAEKGADAAYSSHDALSDLDAQIQRDYDADAIDGMPVSLQLVARRLEEEKVLMMTDVVLQSL